MGGGGGGDRLKHTPRKHKLKIRNQSKEDDKPNPKRMSTVIQPARYIKSSYARYIKVVMQDI